MMDHPGQGVDMTTDSQNKVMDHFAGLFQAADAKAWAGPEQQAEVTDLVKTEPGPGWPTFREIMDQVPDSRAKEAVAELRGIVRRTPIRVCLARGESIPVVLVCLPQWRRDNSAAYMRAQEVLMFRGAWRVIEGYMSELLSTPEEAEGEVWGRT